MKQPKKQSPPPNRNEELARVPANARNKAGVQARLNHLMSLHGEKSQFQEEMGEEQRYGQQRTGNKALNIQQENARAAWERMVNAMQARAKK